MPYEGGVLTRWCAHEGVVAHEVCAQLKLTWVGGSACLQVVSAVGFFWSQLRERSTEHREVCCLDAHGAAA